MIAISITVIYRLVILKIMIAIDSIVILCSESSNSSEYDNLVTAITAHILLLDILIY